MTDSNTNNQNTISSFTLINSVSKDNSIKENINAFEMQMPLVVEEAVKTYNYSSVKFSELSEDEKRHCMGRFDGAITNFVGENVKSHYGQLMLMSEIWGLMHDASYKNVNKLNRRIMWGTVQESRVTGDDAFAGWNGFQVIDLDIKDANVASVVKDMLFNTLCKKHWFVGITLSASGSGIHVYTKISLVSMTIEARKAEYFYNFKHKFGEVFAALRRISYKLLNNDDYVKYNIETSNKILFSEMVHWIDTAMCKPQQGAIVPYCDAAELCTNFVDAPIGYDFNDSLLAESVANNLTISEQLDEALSKIKYFSEDTKSTSEVGVDDLEFSDDVDMSLFKERHYKHNARWQLANTLTKLYGSDKAYTYLIRICQGTPSSELAGLINTAKSHDKGVSLWAANELKKVHGFNIIINKNNTVEVVGSDNIESDGDIQNPVEQISNIASETKIMLKEGQYLSDIQDQIMENMDNITILEAGAGFGKTEMVKRMPGRKILVLPYTSTIESKVLADKTVSDDWLYFYGTNKVTLQDIFGSDKSFVMTIDKFSQLNIHEIIHGGFETIWVDESHLLFVSSYRDVMTPAIERIAQLPAQGVKVVMMSGTPTAENLFFPNKKYIKVEREVDNREKKINVVFSYKKTESDYKMCERMADKIMSGSRILYPTNDGTRRFKQVVSLVQEILNERHFGRKINTFYYKKANSGTKSMKDINDKKTVGNNDIIGCTNFLSVGVDICDKFNFDVFFDTLLMPQDVEQFANRIRNNNLYINIYLKQYDNEGNPVDYESVNDFSLSTTRAELIQMFNCLRMCNDVIERNGEDLMYNPIVNSIRQDNKYISFDEDEKRYYINTTKYKLNIFEQKYGAYITQFPAFCKAMKYYGYEIEVNTDDEQFTDAKRERINELLTEVKRINVNYFTTETFNLIDSLNADNIDIYINEQKGTSYDFFHSPEYEEDRLNNNIKVTNVEVIAKNMPIIKKMYSWFDFSEIKKIYEDNTSRTSNAINQKKLRRICDYITLETKRMKKQFDAPTYAFIMAAIDWSKTNPTATKSELDFFINKWTCNICNKVDKMVTFNPNWTDRETTNGSRTFLEDVKKHFTKLFNTVIETVKVSRKDGTVTTKPFNLDAYDRKEIISDLYGDINLKLVMGDEFTSRVRGLKMENLEDDTDIENLSVTTKAKLDSYNKEINIEGSHLPDLPETFSIPNSAGYYEYSVEDGSGERFIKKQERQYSESSRTNVIASAVGVDTVVSLNTKSNDMPLFDSIETASDKQGAEDTESQPKKFTYNTQEDIEIGVDWDKAAELGISWF